MQKVEVTMQSHIDALKQKHLQLKQKIRSSNNYTQNDTISLLKKQKLLLKEEIMKLENNL